MRRGEDVGRYWLGLAAALTYAAGYSAALGLQLVAYYTGPKAGTATR